MSRKVLFYTSKCFDLHLLRAACLSPSLSSTHPNLPQHFKAGDLPLKVVVSMYFILITTFLKKLQELFIVGYENLSAIKKLYGCFHGFFTVSCGTCSAWLEFDGNSSSWITFKIVHRFLSIIVLLSMISIWQITEEMDVLYLNVYGSWT